MKRTIATVLGMAMLTTTALAANPTIGTTDIIAPGKNIDITFDQFSSTEKGYLDNSNYSITSKKITKGANLVKEIKIDDDDAVVRIVLNKNMEQAEPKSENLVIDTLTIKAKQKNGTVAKNASFTINDITEKVGHTVTELTLDGIVTDLQEGYNKILSTGSYAYGDVTYSEGDLTIDGRAYKGDKLFVDVTFDADTAVLKANPDADMTFVSLETNGLPTSYKAYLTAEEDQYVYKIADGKLYDSGLKWSEDDYAFTGKVRTTTHYVISDMKLSVATTEDGTVEEAPEVTNPDTGANDVAGIAAALAVVSLVAAGAVTLKKNEK